MLISENKLGEITYQGKSYTAIREVHDFGWKLVFVNEEENERIVILTH